MSADEPKLWWMVPALDVQRRVDAMQTAQPPKAELINLGEVYDVLFRPPDAIPAPAANGVQLPVAAADWSAMPIPALRICPRQFAYDYFTLGLPMTSARLRDAMALPVGSVQHLDVDCADCTPKARAMGYQALNVLAFANPLDPTRTGPGHFVEVDSPTGPTTVWVTEPGGPNAVTPRIAWRPGFVPPAPLFRVPGIAWTLATDKLADRVMRAGLTDVIFLDVTNDGTRTGLLPRPPAGRFTR